MFANRIQVTGYVEECKVEGDRGVLQELKSHSLEPSASREMHRDGAGARTYLSWVTDDNSTS